MRLFRPASLLAVLSIISATSAGHGRIIASTLKAARDLHALLASSDFSPFRVIRLSEPDLNIVCFLLHPPSLTTLSSLNALNETIYKELSPDAQMSAPYMITRTRLTCPAYDGALVPLLSSLGAGEESYQEAIAEGLTVLRATVMNPFSADANPDYLPGLCDAVRRAAMSFLREHSASGGSFSADNPIFPVSRAPEPTLQAQPVVYASTA